MSYDMYSPLCPRCGLTIGWHDRPAHMAECLKIPTTEILSGPKDIPAGVDDQGEFVKAEEKRG